MNWNSVKSKLSYAFAISLVSILLWEVCALIVRSESFPHLNMVIRDLWSLLRSFSFWKDLNITLGTTLFSVVIGTILAVILGAAIATSSIGDVSTRRVFNFIRAIPSVVVLPLLVSSIGSSLLTALYLSTYIVTFLLLTFVIRGITDIEPGLIESSYVSQIPFLRKITLVYLPALVSVLGTGLRLGASRAFGTVIASGIIAGTPGLGLALLTAQSSANYPRVFSYVFVMGIVGTIIYSSFSRLEKILIKWRVLT